MKIKKHKNFTVKDLGICEEEVYDIGVSENENFIGNGILVHNSNYICLEEVIDKLGYDFTPEEFRKWMLKFIDDVLQPLIDKTLDQWALDFNTEQLIEFEREKIISNMFVTGMRHYAVKIMDDEGQVYTEETAPIVSKGLENKKMGTPEIFRNILTEVISMLLNSKSKDDVIEMLNEEKEKFKNVDIAKIAVPGKIGDGKYDEYCKPTSYYINNGLKYTNKTPARIKAALNHNYVIAKEGIKKYKEINDNEYIRFVKVKKDNKYGLETVAFRDEWYPEFDKIFEIDYDEIIDKQLFRFVEKWFEKIKWGKLIMDSNTLDDWF